jgi:hypothetical protein
VMNEIQHTGGAIQALKVVRTGKTILTQTYEKNNSPHGLGGCRWLRGGQYLELGEALHRGASRDADTDYS